MEIRCFKCRKNMVLEPITKAINDDETDVKKLKEHYVLYKCPKCEQEIMLSKDVIGKTTK